MDIEEISKLKVAELRAALQEKGLDSKGNKPILIERLQEALAAGGEGEDREEEGSEAEEVQSEEASNDEAEPTNEDSNAPEEEEEETVDSGGYEQNGIEDDADEGAVVLETNAEDEELTSSNPSEIENESNDVPMQEENSEDTPNVKEEVDESEEYKKNDFEEAPVENIDIKEETEESKEISNDSNNVEVKEEKDEVKKEEKDEVKQEDENRHDRRGTKRGQSPERGDKSKRYRSDRDYDEPRSENEPEMDNSVVALDWYNSDLSLNIEVEKRLSASPMTLSGFAYVWHGARTNLGCVKGKVFYEVKVTDNMDVSDLEKEEQHPHVLRCGWSFDSTTLTLGEEKFSWGYGGTGKASTNLKFKDYGKAYGLEDVIGCFLDLDSEPAVMSFTVNGEHQGICYEIPHDELQGNAMFPHILTKNCAFKMNFGAEDQWFEPLTDYTFIGNVPVDELVLGTQRPEKREETEVIMMVGLPAAGKTTWVENYIRENPDKKYNVLGTNALIDRMKIMGLPRKRNYAGRWDVLIDKCTKCLNKLLGMATRRRRNFIIDQTNVYPSAQRRKIKGFVGCKRRAVVICPTDDDLKQRTKKREAEEGKDVPDKAVLEMKANFKLPEVGDCFDEIDFIELQNDEAVKLIESYNKEGEKAGFGQRRHGGGHRGGGNMGYGQSGHRRGHDRRGFGFQNQNRGSGGGGGGGGSGGGGGGYRGGWDRDRDRRGSFERRDRGRGWNRDFRENRDRGSYNRDNRGGGGGGFQNNRDRPFRSGGGGAGGGGSGGGSWQGGFRNQSQNQGSKGGGGGWGNYNQNNQGGYNRGSNWGNNQGYGNQAWGQQQQQQQPQQQQAQSYGATGYNWNQQYYNAQNQQAQQQSYWQGYGAQQAAYGNQAAGYNTQAGYGAAAQTGYNYNQQAAGTQNTAAQQTAQTGTQQWSGYNTAQYNQSYSK